MTEVTYIFHDGFLIRTDEAVLVFDYWKLPDNPTLTHPSRGIPFLRQEDHEKPIYVFVSHHHKDHFNKDIFAWAGLYGNIHYIISKDTAKMGRRYYNPASLYNGPKASPEQVTVLRPGESADLPGISVKAFGSTDIGNSYLVEAGGKKIFHAGDLNAWIWKDESTDKEVRESIEAFSEILGSIASASPCIDIAMFPVDARIGSDFFTGASMFVKEIKVKHFFPMHFELWENELQRSAFRDGALDFSKYANPGYGEYIGLTSSGDSFMSQ